jgi:ABC-type multidrug transport system fused ATPase/permease subunit
LRGVPLSCRDGIPVLEGLEVKPEADEKVALVGVSGSGKSTITKLISKVYDVNQGAMYTDGIDVRGRPPCCISSPIIALT